jgi:ubiquinone/menaquinone biosynthesis C-methylase UbiE
MSPVINSFTGLHAGYYDLVYEDKPYAYEARFVARHLEAVLGRRPRTLLDLACGTGRHAVEFAAMGIEVTGVDLNEELLAHARERAPKIDFVAQDMCELDLGDARFDAVTCLFDSIGYPQTSERVIAALAAAGRHLGAGGALAVEFLHASAMLLHAAPVRVRRWDTEDGGELLRVSETRIDVPRQVMDVKYELVELKPDGTYERWSERQANRFFSVDEMSALMGAAGLDVVESVSAYQESGEIEAETFHVLALARVAGTR